MRRLPVRLGIELAHGRHRLNGVADLKLGVRPTRKCPTCDALDPDLQDAVIATCTNRIGPANFAPVKVAAKGQILALREIEIAAFGGKRDDNRVADCLFDLGHGEWMKLRHHQTSRCI